MKEVFIINEFDMIKKLVIQYKGVVFGIAILLLVIGFFMFNQFKTAPPSTTESTHLIEQSTETNTINDSDGTVSKEGQPSTIIVDIKGAVKKPNTYTMMSTDRVKQLVDKAGLKPDADVSQVNLAEKLTDQKMVMIPSKNDAQRLAQNSNTEGVDQSASNTQPINLNTAEASDLTEIPGIGPAKAQMILAYRDEHGQFQSIDELKEVKGIGDKTFENLKEYFVV
ncbi:helix-hairpin-helix domain-containing protein [Staphylococcus canis]|uniref:Competence protein ComEA n=1 Tax=Staphylococcus canis TaxID=2724942 RepID=A0ABS0TDE6_9STAP|nr:helix-hairpin-helix domain-containing protein [Staphylococcus canis]MBI5975769.1 competence protein ComEA [Staphylococcus canis]